MPIPSSASGADRLPTRPLGRTGMAITRVGFGAWAIGGTEWGAQDDETLIPAIRHAIERGVNWIDTAPIYGLGHSEALVRRALKEMPSPERPYVFTKCSLVWDEANREAPPRRRGSSESLRRELDDSLRRLGIERIDLYQMHRPADDVPLEEYWQTLLELKQAGKVRAVGLSNHTVGQLERARALPPEDWRTRNVRFTGDALVRNLQLTEALKPIAARHDTTLAAVAVAWVLAWPGVTGAIERTGAGSGPPLPPSY